MSCMFEYVGVVIALNDSTKLIRLMKDVQVEKNRERYLEKLWEFYFGNNNEY